MTFSPVCSIICPYLTTLPFLASLLFSFFPFFFPSVNVCEFCYVGFSFFSPLLYSLLVLDQVEPLSVHSLSMLDQPSITELQLLSLIYFRQLHASQCQTQSCDPVSQWSTDEIMEFCQQVGWSSLIEAQVHVVTLIFSCF